MLLAILLTALITIIITLASTVWMFARALWSSNKSPCPHCSFDSRKQQVSAAIRWAKDEMDRAAQGLPEVTEAPERPNHDHNT